MQVKKDQYKYHGNIYDSHHRDQPVGNPGNLTDAAEGDIGGYYDEQQRYHIIKYGGALQGRAGGDFRHLPDGTDHVKTLGRQAAHGVYDIHQGKGNSGPELITQQDFTIEGKSAHKLLIFPFFKNLRQYRFRISRCHAEESGNPHPE